MTEPVAYLAKSRKSGAVNATVKEWSYHDFENIPLYTKEQLQPKVQMTQAEFNEFKKLKLLNPTVDLIAILKIVSSFKYTNLQSRLVCSIESQTEFATLWLRCRYERLEEMIAIVPNMKWFVRSKQQYQPDMDQGISESGYLYLTQGNIYSIEYYEMTPFKDDAKYFDTKDQAEEWCDPSTEAVQLPVEGE
ncbi:hypothetical protein [Leuconostoc mesenteroides]|uniref:hypothetical protein n=1 Tax=Leuconostoc mesenteroides TaxID=1245 RepID=UPI00388912A9